MRTRCALITALGAGLLAPAAAGAVVTATTLTAPASPFHALDLEGPDVVRVNGTASGAQAGDVVDLVCFHAKTVDGALVAKPIAADVAVTGGAFTADVQLGLFGSTPCRLRAVPDGVTDENGAAQFPAVLMLVGARNVDSPGFKTGATQTNFQAYFQQARGGADVQSLLYGLQTSAVDPTTQRESPLMWFAGVALGHASPVVPARSPVVVDGESAYAPRAAATLPGYAGAAADPALPAITIETLGQDSATGIGTVRVREPLVRCSADPGCGAFASTGVTLVREVVHDRDGRMLTVRDRWTSTDGQPHDIDVLYDSLLRSGSNPAWRAGWEGPAFTARANGEVLNPPPGRVGSVLARPAAGDCAITAPCGSLTFSTKPSVLRFAGPLELEVGFVRRVPASGSLPIDLALTTAASEADLTTLTAQAEQAAQAGLSVELTGPATSVGGRTGAATVTGRATTRGGVASLTLDGRPVVPAADGTFSVPVTLAPGANTFTATVTDNAGDTTATSRTVTFTPDADPPAVIEPATLEPPTVLPPPRVAIRGVKFTGRQFELTLSCIGVEGTTCTGTADVIATIKLKAKPGKKARTRKVKLGQVTFTIPGNTRQVWKAAISKTGAKELKRSKRLAAVATARFKIGGQSRTATRNVVVRQPKPAAKKRR